MDPTSEARLALVHPLLATKVRAMAEALASEGEIIHVIQGLRSYAEQAKLYAQGRTTPGPRVTDAVPGRSWHNYGLAVDCAPGVPGVTKWAPDWNVYHPTWQLMVMAGEHQGLASGSRWRDPVDFPHFQLTGIYPVTPPQEVVAMLIHQGRQAVWTAAQIS